MIKEFLTPTLHKSGRLGLILDTSINDVFQARKEDIEPPPSNIGEVKGKYFQGVLSLKKMINISFLGKCPELPCRGSKIYGKSRIGVGYDLIGIIGII